MLIREASAKDSAPLAEVFFNAVQIGAAGAYAQDQRDAWAARQPSADHWAKRLEGLLTLVAQDGKRVVGFVSMRMDDGYLDLAFVHSDFAGRGIGGNLCAVLENRARVAGLKRLTVQASDLLKPVLDKRGWSVVEENQVHLGDVILRNWSMEKALN